MEIKEIRKNGIGNGFSVINPQDGYRKDNTIWNGTCSECGERVHNSVMTKYAWTHSREVKNQQWGYSTQQRSEQCFTV